MGIIRNNQAKPKKGARVAARQSHAYTYGAHQNRLHNVQSLRAIAALLVVLSHLPSMEIKHGGDKILPEFFRFGISGVDLFFVISGFIMVYVTWKSERSSRRSLEFLYARFTRIYPIYWMISAMVFTAWLFVPSIMTFNPEQTNVIKSFLLWPERSFPMLKVAWTLIHELYFYIVFAAVLILPIRYMMPCLTLWCAGVIGGNLLGFSKLSPEMALVFHPLTIEFFFGATAAWLFLRNLSLGKQPQYGKICLTIGLTALIANYIYLAQTLDPKKFPTQWARCFHFGLPAAFITYGLTAIEHEKIRLPKWSEAIGDWSYSLYLSHILALSVLGYLWRPFTRSGPIDNVIALSLMMLGCIFGAAMLWYGVERPMLRAAKHWRARLFP